MLIFFFKGTFVIDQSCVSMKRKAWWDYRWVSRRRYRCRWVCRQPSTAMVCRPCPGLPDFTVLWWLIRRRPIHGTPSRPTSVNPNSTPTTKASTSTKPRYFSMPVTSSAAFCDSIYVYWYHHIEPNQSVLLAIIMNVTFDSLVFIINTITCSIE